MATLQFKKILKFYQNKVKILCIGGFGLENRLQYFDFGIESLRSIREIRIDVDINITQFVSKASLPLDVLSYEGQHNIENLQNFELVYGVSEILEVHRMRMNKQQFFRLSAPRIDVHIGSLTAEDVVNYIRSWQNGEREHLESVHWNLEKSNFSVQAFYNLFGMKFVETGEIQLRVITHNIRRQKATWIYTNYHNEYRSISFEVNDNKPDASVDNAEE